MHTRIAGYKSVCNIECIVVYLLISVLDRDVLHDRSPFFSIFITKLRVRWPYKRNFLCQEIYMFAWDSEIFMFTSSFFLHDLMFTILMKTIIVQELFGSCT